jgi:hypothetical protein
MKASPLEVPDCVFPTDNELEIPTLRLDMQADFLDMPLLPWGHGGGRRHAINRGSWHFYVDDYAFESIWRNPALLPATECRTSIEPNPSVFDVSPIPVAVWATYRKRWVARYWQERGVRIVVDMNVAERYVRMNLRGVPRGWRAYATRGYGDRLEDVRREYELACEHRGSSDVLFIVYGGGDAARSVCRELGTLYIADHRTAVSRIKHSVSEEDD